MCSSRSLGKYLLAAGIAVLLLAGGASAYTLVLKGGKKMQIPDRFVVTPAVLHYEVSPGMNVTLQLAAVDIAETERANNEPAGSFAQRIQKPGLSSANTPAIIGGKNPNVRTVTNRDLEDFRVARIENEKAYEASVAATGRPSLKELRERAERESVEAKAFVERRFIELQAESERQRTADSERRAAELQRQQTLEIDPNSWGNFYWPGGSAVFGDSSGDWFDNGRFSRFGFNFGRHGRFGPFHRRIFVAPRTTMRPGMSPRPGRR